MPHNGFRKSGRSRFPWERFGAPADRLARRSPPDLPAENSDGDIRWELVARVREKIAMGIYDHPAILELAFDRMVESAES